MSSPSSPDAPFAHPATLAIHLDLVGGLAGDMFVAALVDALPDLEAPVQAAVAAVKPLGAAGPVFSATRTGGLAARHFGLPRDELHAQPTRLSAHAPHHHAGHDADHAHTGTPYRLLERHIASAVFDPDAKAHALALLALLGGAEAQAHGIGLDDVHFHELADWDSLLDIVAAGAIAAALAGAQWSASAPPLGGGTVKTAHGQLPVPTPATTWLLTGYPWRDDGVTTERVTPTGAAILRHLVPATRCGALPVSGRLVGSGAGAGTRSLAGIPNLARALVFAPLQDAAAEQLTVVEFDVDDMSGEEIAVAAERLRRHAGVLDLSLGQRAGKKGRTATEFRLLLRPEVAEAVGSACFAETSTLGLRLRDERRRVLPRREVATRVGERGVAVKIAARPDGSKTAKAAQDDAAPVAGLDARRRLRERAERDALDRDETP